MTPGPRALYPELKRRFNGGLFLIHREAAYPLEAMMDRRAHYRVLLPAHTAASAPVVAPQRGMGRR